MYVLRRSELGTAEPSFAHKCKGDFLVVSTAFIISVSADFKYSRTFYVSPLMQLSSNYLYGSFELTVVILNTIHYYSLPMQIEIRLV